MRQALVVLAVVPVLAVAAFTAAAGERQMSPQEKARAAEHEAAAAENLPARRWEADKIRDLARNIAGLPDDVAAQALWLAATAPPRVDTINVFANALSAPSAPVRLVAVSLLAGGNTDDARRLLLNTLALEQNPAVVETIIKGLANLPRNRAVRSLMDVMFLPGATGMATDGAAEELRRLTRAEIGNGPVDWRDWWLDNEPLYD